MRKSAILGANTILRTRRVFRVARIFLSIFVYHRKPSAASTRFARPRSARQRSRLHVDGAHPRTCACVREAAISLFKLGAIGIGNALLRIKMGFFDNI